MGLSIRACQPTNVILPGDTAIGDQSLEAYTTYLKGLCLDESPLKLKADDTPTRFMLRQWTDEHRDAIRSQMTDRHVWKTGVRCAMLGFTGYTVMKDGLEVPAPVLDRHDEGRLGNVVALSWFRDVNMPDDHLEALYDVAKHLSEAAPPLSKPSGQESGPPKSESQESSGG